MDSEEKKRISNEKRLKAIKEWKKNQTVQKIKFSNSNKILDNDITYTSKNKPKLFESDEEDALDKPEEYFKIRPQFEGFHGQELLEMSSQFSGRFKLDERFKNDDEPQSTASVDGEKEKNMKILQSVLGYEVITKASNKNLPKKRQIRFDPEDESASKYVKISSSTRIEKGKKKKSKKIQNDDEEHNIPISTERYIEVSSNLKDILSMPVTTTFSLTEKFDLSGLETSNTEKFNEVSDVSTPDVLEEEIKQKYLKDKSEGRKHTPYKELKYFIPKTEGEYFFIKEGDARLKEGIEFFKRPKSLEEIRDEWQRKREFVLDLFRKKKRASQRSHFTHVQIMQKKQAIRNQN